MWLLFKNKGVQMLLDGSKLLAFADRHTTDSVTNLLDNSDTLVKADRMTPYVL